MAEKLRHPTIRPSVAVSGWFEPGSVIWLNSLSGWTSTTNEFPCTVPPNDVHQTRQAEELRQLMNNYYYNRQQMQTPIRTFIPNSYEVGPYSDEVAPLPHKTWWDKLKSIILRELS